MSQLEQDPVWRTIGLMSVRSRLPGTAACRRRAG